MMLVLINQTVLQLGVVPKVLLIGVILVTLFVMVVVFFKTRKLLLSVLSDSDRQMAQLEVLQEENKKKELEFLNYKELTKNQKEEIEVLEAKLSELEQKIDSEALNRTSDLHLKLEKAEENNKLKEAFLEKISREVRTPLNAILGFINLLNNPDLPDHDRAYFYKYIQNSGNNLLGLIDNIIDFSKLETNELQIQPINCKIHVLLADLIEKYRNRIIRENKDLTIIYNNSEPESESLVDCKRVIHITDQLLSNAFINTPEGKIELNYTVKDDFHVISIKDTGRGIDKKYQDIIFERFYQIEADTHDSFQGAGLGLTIVKGLIDLLGGRITLESEPGKGSNFTFYIPFIGTNNLQPQVEQISRNYDWSGKNILIAEDEDSNYHYLEAILRKTNANLTRAHDGVQFLEIMDNNKEVDLVLLDIKMPGINGFKAIKVVRQQDITIPVIAQTAFNQPEDKQRCLDSGCNDYVSKPIDKELLLTKIARFFGN